ncbi:MAG: hypothetical protein ABI353_22680 [Isosphaeraceae bacterium]
MPRRSARERGVVLVACYTFTALDEELAGVLDGLAGADETDLGCSLLTYCTV